jgi:hypothetical protein
MEDHNPAPCQDGLRHLSSYLLALQDMGTRELREEYERLFGEPTRSRNAGWLRRKVAWRVQELAHGDLSDRAQARIDEVLDWMDREQRHPIGAHLTAPLPKRLRTRTQMVAGHVRKAPRDPRLPPAGTTLQRAYKGTTHAVLVQEDGFEWRGRRFDSLSEVATAIGGSRRSGFRFFNLNAAAAAKAPA